MDASFYLKGGGGLAVRREIQNIKCDARQIEDRDKWSWTRSPGQSALGF